MEHLADIDIAGDLWRLSCGCGQNMAPSEEGAMCLWGIRYGYYLDLMETAVDWAEVAALTAFFADTRYW